MVEPDVHVMKIHAAATRILGPEADIWLHRRNRELAGLAPVELAQCGAPGARVVLLELMRLEQADQTSS
jgi:hypothetical protein